MSETKQQKQQAGLRFNSGKIRYDLIPDESDRLLAEVLTYGAEKYTIRDEEGKVIVSGDNNWRNGMSWMSVYASAMRHMKEWKKNKDFDAESGIKHIGHAITNLAFLAEYYRIAPEWDDRQWPIHRKIGLDIDEVLCDWTLGWSEEFGTDPRPKNWYFSYDNKERFDKKNKEELERIYSNLKPKMSPDDLPFEPWCYITSRSIDPKITQNWIERNGFPTRPIYTVKFGESKVRVAKESGLDIFVDDSYDNFVELNRAGITTYLYDAPHNQKYDVGYRRIKDLKELL